MINMRFLFIVSLLFAVSGCIWNSQPLDKPDDCRAPGLTWMEVTEDYDKQIVIDLAAKFEAATKADGERIKAPSEGSAGVSLTASLEQLARSTSGRKVKVSQDFFQKANAYRTSVCNIERWLKDGTFSNQDVRDQAQDILLTLSREFSSLKSSESPPVQLLPAPRPSENNSFLKGGDTNIVGTLIQKCGQPSSKLKRRSEIFIPRWLSVLNYLRNERTTYDLQNLAEVMGRSLVGLSGQDLIEEAKFTIHCLESEGYLKIEKANSTGQWWGVSFENIRFEFEERWGHL